MPVKGQYVVAAVPPGEYYKRRVRQTHVKCLMAFNQAACLHQIISTERRKLVSPLFHISEKLNCCSVSDSLSQEIIQLTKNKG